MNDTLREQLAAYAHDAWAGWMRYLFDQSQSNADGSVTIPAWAVERWQRQAATAYADLPLSEQASDLAEADKMLALTAESYTANEIRAAQTLRALVRHSSQLGDRREWTTPAQDARMEADIHAARVHLTTLMGSARADALLQLLQLLR